MLKIDNLRTVLNKPFEVSIVELEQVDSTSSYLSGLVQNGAREGTVVWSKEQSAGRGQRGNQWVAEPGKNLTFSILLRPSFLPAAGQFMLSKVISLALLNVVRGLIAGEESRSVKIKWPNDIYIGRSKVAGILIENSIQIASIQHSIIGIGLNLNQQTFPAEAGNAASIIHFTEQPLDIRAVLIKLLVEIEKQYSRLQFGNSELIDKEYLDNLFGLNLRLTFIATGLNLEGEITGITESGNICIRSADGAQMNFGFKEVEFVF